MYGPGGSSTTTAIVVAFLALVALVAGGLAVVSLAPDLAPSLDRSGPVEGTAVSACTTIDRPGTYVLEADLADDGTDRCLRIRSSDVVIDGDGHAVSGSGEFGSAGIVAVASGDATYANVTVRDVSVSGWDDGVLLDGVEGATVEAVTASDNRVGLKLLRVHDSRVAATTASDNSLRGISLLESARNNTLESNAATDNGLFGVHLVEPGVTNNTLDSTVASGNEHGVVLIGAEGNRIVDTEAEDNRIAGVWLSAADDNRVAGTVGSGQFYGVSLADGASGNVIVESDLRENEVGVRLRSSDGNRIANNTIRESGDNAVLVISSDDVEVTGNVGRDNARGITVLRSNGTVERDNDLS